MMRLGPLDATFLELEDTHPAAHMHVGGILLFDGPAPSIAEVVETLAERTASLPRFAQRLSGHGPGTLRRATWVDCPGFDVADHVRRVAVPPPGGQAELEELAADFWSHRLDRDRPLWELLLVEGLEDGRWALVTKTHHCMVDGVSALDAGRLYLDGLPPAPAAGPPHHGTGLPSPADLVATARTLAETAIRDGLTTAPATSLATPIGPRRRFRAVQVDLRDVRAVKQRLGGTVNDVVLALVAGALRRLLCERGDPLPAGGLRAMVPVDVRRADEHGGELGNRVSALFVPLEVAEPDPVDRYLAVVRAAEQHKRGGEAAGTAALMAAFGAVPPAAHAIIGLPVLGRRLFNLTVTNVRGPAETVSAFGSPLRAILPLVPLAADHALGIAVVSYAGAIAFGLNGDRESMPDLDVVAAGIEEELATLCQAAGIVPVA